MYKVKVITIKEIVEVDVDAMYCLVDAHNNLVFENEFPVVTLEPVEIFSANRWVSAKRVRVRRAMSSVKSGTPLQ